MAQSVDGMTTCVVGHFPLLHSLVSRKIWVQRFWSKIGCCCPGKLFPGVHDELLVDESLGSHIT